MGSHGSAHLDEAGLDEAADDDADDLEAVAPPDTSESQPRENIAPGAVVSPQVLTAEANQWLATGHMCTVEAGPCRGGTQSTARWGKGSVREQ